jgi:hypothetical protein
MSRMTASPVPTRESARGRHAEPVHGLAAAELAQRRAQHRAPVGGARVGREAGALELELLAAAVRGEELAERNRAPVAELPGPVPELVAGIARCVRLHAGQQPVAGKHRERLRTGAREAERRSEPLRPGEQPRRCDRGRRNSRIAGIAHLPRHVLLDRIAGQVAHESVLEPRLGQVAQARISCDGR